jgi:DNA modification methylase
MATKKKPQADKPAALPDIVQWRESTVLIDALKPYDRNPRRISKEAFEKLKRSLQEDGYHQRLVVTQDMRIVGGHQRVRALKEIGVKEVQILQPDRELDLAAFRRILIRDNLPFGEFDFEMLANDFDKEELLDIGMPAEWLDEFGVKEENTGLTDPDEVPAIADEAISMPGDIWILGKHRIICGDSTNATDVGALLGDVKPMLMVTDPPYGVEYNADWRNKAIRANGSPIAGKAVGKVMNDDKSDWREAWALFPGEVAYVWHASSFIPEVAESLRACDFKLRNLIIWAKSNLVIGRGDYHHQHEPCWYAVRNNGKGHWNGDRKQTTLWQIDKPQKSETGHSTQKPVECMKRPIENNSSPGQAVYEPFSGSGTTIIAGEMTGRSVYAVELNPLYVDIAVKRWEAFTGEEAIHAGTGETFKSKMAAT